MLKLSMRNHSIFRIIFCAISLACVLFVSNGYARPFFGRTLYLPLQKAAPGTGQILIDFNLPANHEFAKEAPSTIFIRTKHPEIFKTAQTQPEPLPVNALPYSIPYTANPGETVAVMDVRVHFCDEVSKICLSDFIRIKFPVQIEPGVSSQISLRIPLKSKTTA